MTTLVVLVCVLVGCFIGGRAANPTGQGHLSVPRGSDGGGQEWSAPDVQPGNKYFVTEGSPVRIRCAASDAGKKSDHPPVLSWFKVNTTDWSTKKVVSGSDESLLVLPRVNDAHDAGRYDCVASHTFSNLSIEIFVSSDSAAAERHGPLQANESLTLTCKADNPQWKLNGLPINEEKMKKEGKELKIEAPVSGARTGVYMCSATGEGVAQIQMFHVLGAPVDVKEVTKNLMQGEERAVIKCDGVGYPVPAVKWQIEDDNGVKKDLNPSEAKANKTEFSEYNGVKDAMITVLNLEFSDAGKYICTFDNGYGSASHNTTLRVKDKLAALWPFLGIVVEVIVLVAVIFIYEKRQSSKDQPVADEEEEEEEQKKALTSGDAVDVRQRGTKS